MRLPKDADVGGQFKFIASDAAATTPIPESDEPTNPSFDLEAPNTPMFLVRRSPDSLPLTRSLYADDTALSLNPGLANSMDTNTSTVSLDPDAALSMDTNASTFSLDPDAALSVDTCSVVDGLPRPRTS